MLLFQVCPLEHGVCESKDLILMGHTNNINKIGRLSGSNNSNLVSGMVTEQRQRHCHWRRRQQRHQQRRHYHHHHHYHHYRQQREQEQQEPVNQVLQLSFAQQQRTATLAFTKLGAILVAGTVDRAARPCRTKMRRDRGLNAQVGQHCIFCIV